ncbi:MAG: hypothetical protein VKN15_05165 [Cyanobacteriota bacterium]|nr:hypothetical protein [Cyanobacteriota bacterium]
MAFLSPAAHCTSLRSSLLLALAVALGGVVASPARAERCQFLNPVGGDGTTPIVTKTISPGNPLGRPNWNTDFFVTQPFSSYKLFFTADSSVSATYPLQAYLKFTDGSNLRVADGNFTPTPGTGGAKRVYAVPGKTVSQVNIKVGSTSNMAATGFTYRISVQGCN